MKSGGMEREITQRKQESKQLIPKSNSFLFVCKNSNIISFFFHSFQYGSQISINRFAEKNHSSFAPKTSERARFIQVFKCKRLIEHEDLD